MYCKYISYNFQLLYYQSGLLSLFMTRSSEPKIDLKDMSFSFQFLTPLNFLRYLVFCMGRGVVLSCVRSRLLLCREPEQEVVGGEVDLGVTSPPIQDMYVVLVFLHVSLDSVFVVSYLKLPAKVGHTFSSDTNVNFPNTYSFGFCLFFPTLYMKLWSPYTRDTSI